MSAAERTRPTISVCISTAGRHELLRSCLRSLEAQESAPPFEVLVVSDPDPHVAELVRTVGLPGSVVEVAAETGRRVARSDKRNVLLGRAQGDLLLFLDDDVVAAPDLLRCLDEDAREHPGAVAFGGPNLTPGGSTRFQVVQGAVLGSLVGAGPARRRWGVHPAGPAREPHLTLCNLAVRRHAMVAFPVGLHAGEECAVLNGLRRQGHGLWYDPRLAVFHERRPTRRGFAAQVVGYGRGRGWVVREALENLHPLLLAPMAVLGYVVALPVLVPLTAWTLLPAGVYLGSASVEGIRIARQLRRGWRVAPAATAMILALHACYGAGSVAGLLVRPRRVAVGVQQWAVSPGR